MTPGMNVLSPPTPPSAGTFNNFTKVGVCVGGGGGGMGHTSYRTEFAKRVRSNPLVICIIFVVFMEIMSLENKPLI